jgi:hypothetical protein
MLNLEKIFFEKKFVNNYYNQKMLNLEKTGCHPLGGGGT